MLIQHCLVQGCLGSKITEDLQVHNMHRWKLEMWNKEIKIEVTMRVSSATRLAVDRGSVERTQGKVKIREEEQVKPRSAIPGQEIARNVRNASRETSRST